ncbi:group III truncated hemoglobin [uncultured Sneathiella sp.]|jgi:hemoglobin|uniref:group III truncated hemoglobin n=1 Tax=uncultured Sneathiella sp. TaxID=879315 RepID=UPI0030D7A90B|tara:strand:- start:818 stop:1285 length:468 start_codon:yes stop_codon:yes gene_type:complete
MPQPPHRVAITTEIQNRTGIDDAMIETLVHRFYARIRDDELLGPIFDARIEDWDTHLQKMCIFWSSVTLLTGEYHGQPMVKHVFLPVDSRHFDRWLALFEETAHEVCPPPAAEYFMDRARRIASSFELGIASRNKVLLGRDERYVNEELDAELEG